MPGRAALDPVGMTITTIVVVLELDDTADCPSGSASAAGGETRTFHGWLGLAAAIDALAFGGAKASMTQGDPT